MKKKYIIFLLILWIVALISGGIYFTYGRDRGVKTIEKNMELKVEKEQEKVVIYLPNKNMKALTKVEAEIDIAQSTKDRIYKVARKNIELLAEKGFIQSKDINLFNVYFNDKTIYLDFSSQIGELDSNTQKSLLSVYSIVNSVTEKGGYNRVKILVDGKDGSKILGKFYNRNMGI